MPDRDIFLRLDKPLRQVARNLMAAVRGGDLDPLILAKGLDWIFDGGVNSLPKVLKYFNEHHSGGRQSCFQNDSYASVERQELVALVRHHGRGDKDTLLLREALQCWQNGVRDESTLLRRFSLRVLDSRIIEPQGGVRERLQRMGEPLDMQQLVPQLAPVLDAAAEQMRRSPSFKRLGLTARFQRPVDPFLENLLG